MRIKIQQFFPLAKLCIAFYIKLENICYVLKMK